MSLWKGLVMALVALALISGGTLLIYKQMATPPDPPATKPPDSTAPALKPAATPVAPPANVVPPIGNPFPIDSSLSPLLKPPELGVNPSIGTPVPGKSLPGAGTMNKPSPGSVPPTAAHAPAMQLTGEQQAKIDSIQKAYQQKMEAISKDKKLDNAAKEASAIVAVQKVQIDVLDVLTPEQVIQEQNRRLDALPKQLHLTPDQLTQLRNISTDANNQTRVALQNKRLSDKEKAVKLIQIVNNGTAQTIKVFTPTQRKQLEQIEKERQTAMKNAAGPTLEDLHPTADQRAKIQTLLTEGDTKALAIIQNKKITVKEKQTQLADLQKDTDTQIMKILTPEQQQKFEELQKKRQAAVAEKQKK